MSNKISGGKGDKLNPKSIDQHELKIGIKHEMEHTKDVSIAKEIALDHLAENPKYYTELKKAGIDEIKRMQKLAGINELEINNPRINISAELEEYQEKYIMYFINFEGFDYEFIGYCEEYRNYHDVRVVYDPIIGYNNDGFSKHKEIINKIINSPKYKYFTYERMDNMIYIYIPINKIRFKPGESPEELIKND